MPQVLTFISLGSSVLLLIWYDPYDSFPYFILHDWLICTSCWFFYQYISVCFYDWFLHLFISSLNSANIYQFHRFVSYGLILILCNCFIYIMSLSVHQTGFSLLPLVCIISILVRSSQFYVYCFLYQIFYSVLVPLSFFQFFK